VTGAEIAQIILAAATLVTAIGGAAIAIRTGAKVEATHTLVNGQSGALTALTGKAAYAEGMLAGSTELREHLPDQARDTDSDQNHLPD
jgi:hypothetical protein